MCDRTAPKTFSVVQIQYHNTSCAEADEPRADVHEAQGRKRNHVFDQVGGSRNVEKCSYHETKTAINPANISVGDIHCGSQSYNWKERLQ